MATDVRQELKRNKPAPGCRHQKASCCKCGTHTAGNDMTVKASAVLSVLPESILIRGVSYLTTLTVGFPNSQT